MSHYDLGSLILLGLIIGIPCLFIGYALSAISWRQADQMVHEALDEIKPVFPQHEQRLELIVLDAQVLMEQCPHCQQERERVS